MTKKSCLWSEQVNPDYEIALHRESIYPFTVDREREGDHNFTAAPELARTARNANSTHEESVWDEESGQTSATDAAAGGGRSAEAA